MPLPLRLWHIPIPCSATTHTPLQMACWLQSRIQQTMIDNRLERYLAKPISKNKPNSSQKREWVKKMLALDIPPSSSPLHFEHLLKHVGPPPTVISFMPQPTFDLPGLNVDANVGEKAKRLAMSLPKLVYVDSTSINRLARDGFTIDGFNPDVPFGPRLFTWVQLRKVVETLLKACNDMEKNVDIKVAELLSDKPHQSNLSMELISFTEALKVFLVEMQGIMTEVKDASPSMPLVTDLAATHKLRPTDNKPAFFGPGTLMLWPVMDLTDTQQLTSGAKLASEQALHDLLALTTIKFLKTCFGVDAYNRPGETGVWLDDPVTDETRRIATVRPSLGCNMVTSFGVGLQLAALPKHVATDQTMTSLAETCMVGDTPDAMGAQWTEAFGQLLAENAENVPKRDKMFKIKKREREKVEDSLIQQGPVWTVDHLEDFALGWRAQTPVDDTIMSEPDTTELEGKDGGFFQIYVDSPLHILGDLFDSASTRFTNSRRRGDQSSLAKQNLISETIRKASQVAQGRPWLGFDKSMDTWYKRPVNTTNMSQLDLKILDHRAFIIGNGMRPSIQPIDHSELITESDLIWPDLTSIAVSIDQANGGSLSLEASYKHYCAWVLRVLRESLFGRQLDARLTDHSVRYTTGEMLAKPGVLLSILNGAMANIPLPIQYGLNHIQCAAFYRRALLLGPGQEGKGKFPLSRQEARYLLPELRTLSDQEKDLPTLRNFAKGYIGGLDRPEGFEDAVGKSVKHPGEKELSKLKLERLEARYGKEILRATGLKKAPKQWKAQRDSLGRH